MPPFRFTHLSKVYPDVRTRTLREEQDVHGNKTWEYRTPLYATSRHIILLVLLSIVVSSCGETKLRWGGTWRVEHINGFDSSVFIDRLLREQFGKQTGFVYSWPSFGVSKPQLKLYSHGVNKQTFELSFTVRDGDVLVGGDSEGIDPFRSNYDYRVDFVFTGGFVGDQNSFDPTVDEEPIVHVHNDLVWIYEGIIKSEIISMFNEVVDSLYFLQDVGYNATPSPDYNRVLLTHPIVSSVDLVKIESY